MDAAGAQMDTTSYEEQLEEFMRSSRKIRACASRSTCTRTRMP